MAIWENIIIYSRGVETWQLNGMFVRGWRIRKHEKKNEVTGRKGFAVNKDSKTASKTADKWSNAVPVLRQKARSKIAMLFNDQGEIVEERLNTPMKGLRVFNLEHRGQGGRAYKVLDDDGYVWDMREGVLLEAMITVGVSPGGTIGGEFVWGNVGSQGKLIRVGSQLHDELTKDTKRRKLKKIGVRALEPGGLYKAGSGQMAVFHSFVHSHGKKKQQLWFETFNYGDDTDLENAQQSILNSDRHYGWKVKTSSSFVEKMGVIDLSIVPDPIPRLRTEGITHLINSVAQWDGDRGHWNYLHRRYADFATFVRKHGGGFARATLTPLGTPVDIPDGAQTILDRISA